LEVYSPIRDLSKMWITLGELYQLYCVFLMGNFVCAIKNHQRLKQ
jgi:hypothetical protein